MSQRHKRGGDLLVSGGVHTPPDKLRSGYGVQNQAANRIANILFES